MYTSRYSSSFKRITNVIKKYNLDNENIDNVNIDNNSPFLIEKKTKTETDSQRITIDYVTFGTFINKNSNYFTVIKINIPGTYPFKSPDVYINGYCYKTLLAIDEKWLKIFKINKCMCCNSILCHWGANYNVTNILNEINVNLNYKIRINEIRLCRQLVNQKFGHYIPIEEFL